MFLRKAAGLRCMHSSGVFRRALWANNLPESLPSFTDDKSEWRSCRLSFPPGLAYQWQVGGQGRVRGSWSSGPVSPWCSTAYASWTGWWHHQVSVEVLGGNWLQLLAASRWDGGSPPGSSRLQDTETQKESLFGYTLEELKALFQKYTLYIINKKPVQWYQYQFIYTLSMVCLH